MIGVNDMTLTEFKQNADIAATADSIVQLLNAVGSTLLSNMWSGDKGMSFSIGDKLSMALDKSTPALLSQQPVSTLMGDLSMNISTNSTCLSRQVRRSSPGPVGPVELLTTITGISIASIYIYKYGGIRDITEIFPRWRRVEKSH